MELLSNTQFNIHKYYGNIALMYYQEDEINVRGIKEKLDYVGYQYNSIPIGPSILSQRYFIQETDKILQECSCLIVILNNAFDKLENIVYRNVFWYCIGYVNSNNRDSVIPIKLDNVKPLDLKGTPIQNLNIITSSDELMNTLTNKYSSKLLCYNYYQNKRINFYASKRIYYRSLNFKFKIYENCFRNAKNAYTATTGLEITEAEFEKLLIEKLTCGCRVVSFGAENRLNPPLYAYRDEVHPIITDSPMSISGKKQYVLLPDDERIKTGVRAELFMDILIPVHKILGTYFKCYITLDDEYSYLEPVLALFTGDFSEDKEIIKTINEEYKDWEKLYPKEVYIDKELKRLYYSSGLSVSEYQDSSLVNIGNFVDFIFPQ